MNRPFDLDSHIRRWRSNLASAGTLLTDDADELESHLRDEIDALVEAGLHEDEAFLIAVRRIGQTHELAREYYKVNGSRLWKQLDEPETAAPRNYRGRHEPILVAILAVGAALASQLPLVFGLSYTGEGTVGAFREVPFIVFPFLAAYVAWKRELSIRHLAAVAIALVAGFLIVHLYPFAPSGDTVFLATVHLLLLYWSLYGLLYVASRDGATRGYADFLTYSGELFIYTVLICLGGGVLLAVTSVIFRSIGIDLSGVIANNLVTAGGLAAPVVATYLVEAKRSVIENMAPVLAKLFVPLFSIALLAFLIAMAVTGTSPATDREMLIALDLLLLVVLAMVFYSISSRTGAPRITVFDYANVTLIGVATIVDIVALVSIILRLATFGFSANKTAALGENVLMLGQLVILIVTYLRYLRGRTGFESVERSLVRYVPAYALWFTIVVIVFPPLFGFV